jgi:WD40 repeat protein
VLSQLQTISKTLPDSTPCLSEDVLIRREKYNPPLLSPQPSRMAFGSRFASSSSSSTTEPSCGNPNDFETPDPPMDSVSCLDWSPVMNHLAVGSWDTTIRMYEVSPEKHVHVSIGRTDLNSSHLTVVILGKSHV